MDRDGVQVQDFLGSETVYLRTNIYIRSLKYFCVRFQYCTSGQQSDQRNQKTVRSVRMVHINAHATTILEGLICTSSSWWIFLPVSTRRRTGLYAELRCCAARIDRFRLKIVVNTKIILILYFNNYHLISVRSILLILLLSSFIFFYLFT